MILPIYLYGAEVLRQEDKPVDLSDKAAVQTLIANMKETLVASEGCGLAAPQVGVPVRLLIVDGDCVSDTYDYLKGFRRTMINPVVTFESKDKCEYSEGCLSVPGIYADVVRPSTITVEYLDENFEKQTETFDKFAARMIQHELDHLDGHLFIDRIAPIRRKMYAKKLLGIQKGKVSTHYKSK